MMRPVLIVLGCRLFVGVGEPPVNQLPFWPRQMTLSTAQTHYIQREDVQVSCIS